MSSKSRADSAIRAAITDDPAGGEEGFVCLWVNDVKADRVFEYLDKVEKYVIPLYEKHGVKLLGCWRGGFGPKSNEVIFLIDYGNMKTFNELYTDPEYVEMDDEMDFMGMRSNKGWLLNPVSFSPIK
jgi:hypothetical protein